MNQISIELTIFQKWAIRRPFVYRYMDKKYVDEFFDSGSLRLSSFAAFNKHTDEQRKDGAEGHAMVSTALGEDKLQFVAMISKESPGLVMCGSTIFDPKIGEIFNSNSGFRINDTTSFAASVARCISGFMGGVEGFCIYQDKKIIENKMIEFASNKIPSIQNTDGIDIGQAMSLAAEIAGDEIFFVKDKKFQHQVEYRLVWYVQNMSTDFVHIQCPDLKRFCTRFEDLF